MRVVNFINFDTVRRDICHTANMSLKNLEKVAVFITPRKKILTAIRYRLHIISIAEKWPAIAVTRKIAFHIKNGMCAHC